MIKALVSDNIETLMILISELNGAEIISIYGMDHRHFAWVKIKQKKVNSYGNSGEI